MNKEAFEKFVRHQCEKNGIIFKVEKIEKILTPLSGQLCSGFFEENETNPPTLGIASNLPDDQFFSVLAHEYSHACQFLENSPYWNKVKLTSKEEQKYSKKINAKGCEAGDIIQYWLDGVLELTSNELKNLTKRATDVEFDCEKRTISLIKKMNLAIDVKFYAQQANAYLFSYFFAATYRLWPSKPLYMIKEIYSLFPNTIDPKFCQNIPENYIEDIFNKLKNNNT